MLNRKIKHTHIGSIGNLSLDKIKEKSNLFYLKISIIPRRSIGSI